MALIERTSVINNSIGQFTGSGAPSAGTDEVHTITIGGTPGGTFTYAVGGYTTAPITWSATNTTLFANADAAIEALPNVGTGGCVVAVGTMTAGVGTMTVTFSGGNRARQPLGTPTVTPDAAFTTAGGTISVARTTPGVVSSASQVGLGSTYTDVSSGVIYSNTGTSLSPTWTKVGVQT